MQKADIKSVGGTGQTFALARNDCVAWEACV